MAYSSEFRALLENAGAGFLPYGNPTTENPAPGVELVDTFGEYEAEYAMIRKGVAILLSAQVGVIDVTGADRLSFLHAMLTNDTKSLLPGQARRAFFVSKTGRVDADLLVLAMEDRARLIVDRLVAPKAAQALNKFIFSEDAAPVDVSPDYQVISLHGPAGPALLKHALGLDVIGMENLRHQNLTTADGIHVQVLRHDQTGSIGLHLIIPAASLSDVFQKLTDAVGGVSPDPHAPAQQRPVKGRAIGWLAFNTARIEAGSPLYFVDFGPDSLPAETGLLGDAVSFTKGCYIGQEIVARMHNLGHPKRVLVGLRFEDDRLPLSGSQVMTTKADGTGETVGAITSSATSPMLSGHAIAFASIKWGKHNAGTKVMVPAEGEMVPATVAGLKFLP
jgi:folate-binding protein YgfZ